MLTTSRVDHFRVFVIAASGGFDRDRYPIWRDWLANAGAHSGRAAGIEGLGDAGVPDLPGARDRW